MPKRNIKDHGDPMNWKRVNETEEKNITDAIPVSTEVSRPGPFRTGDEVEVSDNNQNWEKRCFSGYTTDGLYITTYGSTWKHCRFPYKKQQHTISCTDEVLEKVKKIDGVDFISDDSTGKSE